MRPLDGGVLSLGRARTPARGRWAEPLFFSLGHRGRLLLRLFYERRCANEREGEAKNELGFERAAAVVGFFIRPKCEDDRRSEINGQQRIGPL